MESVRAHYQSRKNKLSNGIRGHLAEFGLIVPKGYKSLRTQLPLILEDAENGLPMPVRMAINIYWQDRQLAHQKVMELEKEKLVELNQIPSAKEILKIEGIGPVCASGLICTLGDGSVFKLIMNTNTGNR